MDVVIISPEPGRQKEIGQRLLALADSPYQVQWVTWPQAGYAVPLDLFVKFDAGGEDEAEPQGQETSKRRRRRGKEVAESTDNNTSEEE